MYGPDKPDLLLMQPVQSASGCLGVGVLLEEQKRKLGALSAGISFPTCWQDADWSMTDIKDTELEQKKT